ncbi:protein Wfdc21-like [Vombatus ursinus]|uniref:protein Wfdc21-like n=1 Tax=Vombatus ursinus TaxID=29139 RepID=UPI000FFD1578|nr:protein Wfdc21-like [Vombatus ursinus]
MKLSSSLLFLLFLLTFTMDQQEAKVISNSFLGACVELCGGDWDCEPEERCVSNGCGHVCTDQSV